jgi:hypothetical protein
MPNVKAGRKRICGGAEVITSREGGERMKETWSKNVKDKKKENNEDNRKQSKKKRVVILNN